MLPIQFSINWKLTCFTAFFFPLLIYLGIWQLNRAEEKRTILENWAGQQAAETSLDEHSAVSLGDTVDSSIPQGKLVEFTGTFDVDHYWLQEGKIFQSQPGYLVLMRVTTTTGDNLIVNRGWVPANPDRRILPAIIANQSLQNFKGRIRIPSEAPMTSETSNPLNQWPHRILELELDIMSMQAGVALKPFIIDLVEDDPNSFTVLKRKIPISPEKHLGYAVQWFMLATTLGILWLIANSNIASLLGFTSKTNNKKNHD